jgi:hypothetical protein
LIPKPKVAAVGKLGINFPDQKPSLFPGFYIFETLNLHESSRFNVDCPYWQAKEMKLFRDVARKMGRSFLATTLRV